jgi:urate oxidase
MWLDLEWSYTTPDQACSEGRVSSQVRQVVHEVFQTVESGSIQQLIHRMGTRVLADISAVEEIHLEANNRTWDTITERAGEGGVYTDARPPYGCLGLRLRR